MKFRADHVLDGISLADYAELYFDEAFNVALCQAVRLEREPLSMERKGNLISRRVRVEPQGREIPAPVAKVLGTNRFSYVEELSFDLDRCEGTWRTIPALLPEKVTTGGSLRFVDAGGSARRIVEGEIEVRLFGVGGIVERFICGDAEKSYADAAEFTRTWVRRAR